MKWKLCSARLRGVFLLVLLVLFRRDLWRPSRGFWPTGLAQLVPPGGSLLVRSLGVFVLLLCLRSSGGCRLYGIRWRCAV